MPSITDVDDIKSRTQNLEDRSQARFNQYAEDESLWRLEKYILQEVSSLAQEIQRRYPAFTGNDPRNLADLLLGMLVRHPLVAHGDLYEAKTERQEDEISVHERFATGLWREVDVQRALRGELPFQTDLAWFHALRGGSLVRYWLQKDREHPFAVDIWDPWDCVWERGRTGLSYACHHYRAEEYEVRETWPKFGLNRQGEEREIKTDVDGNVEVWDAWWKDNGNVFNAVAIGDRWAKKPKNHTEERKLKEIPVQLTRSLGAPVGPRVRTIGSRKWLTDQWESIYGANREMFALYNRVMTIFSLVIRDGPLGFMHYKLGPSESIVAKLEDQIGPLRVVQAKGEFRRVDPPQMAPAAAELVAAASGALQRGGAPYSAFGQAPFQLSGVALSQLQGAMEIRTERLSQSMCTTYKAVTDGVIQQYINSGRQLALEGVDRRQVPWRRDFAAAELKKRYHLEFHHRTDLPIHQMQEANVAQIWAKLGVSLVRIYDEMLHIQDPNWEYRRKLQETADQNPVLAGLKLAREFRRKARIAAEEGDDAEAGEYTQYAEVVLAQIKGAQQQVAQEIGAPPLPPPEAGAPENFGQGGSFTMNQQNLPQEARLQAIGMVGPQGG